MYLPTSAQNDAAARIAGWVRENATGYGAVAAEVGRSGVADAAVVTIARRGETVRTAKVIVRRTCIEYMSKLGAHISYPTTFDNAGPIVGALLSLEED